MATIHTRFCNINNIRLTPTSDNTLDPHIPTGYTSDDMNCTVRVIKSRRMRWAGQVARMGEERGVYGVCWGNRREEDHWGDLGIDGWIILGRISRR